MENNLSCAIVRDLLPSYTDGLTGEATNKAVEAHLASCVDCAKALRLMREPEDQKIAPSAEVDFLKKLRRRGMRKSLIIGIVLMLIGMSLIGSRIFYVGQSADASDVLFEIAVDGSEVHLTARLVSSGLGISRVTFSDSNGMVQVKVYTAPKAFFNHGDFMASYTAASPVAQIRTGSAILWENGVFISPTASKLYAEINPFVGDMPSNERIASILGVSEQLGLYTNELQTEFEPYGWTLILETPVAAAEESAARDIMTADAYVMLATIGNLGQVAWEYRTEVGARECTVTAQHASTYAGRDIKEFAQSASALQSLLERLSLKWSGILNETLQESGAFHLVVTNYSNADIHGIVMNYYLASEPIGTRAVGNADNSVFKPGDEFVFDFIPEDFPAGTTGIDLSAFSFDLSAVDGNGSQTFIRQGIPIAAKHAWRWYFSLTGDFASGFTLNEG